MRGGLYVEGAGYFTLCTNHAATIVSDVHEEFDLPNGALLRYAESESGMGRSWPYMASWLYRCLTEAVSPSEESVREILTRVLAHSSLSAFVALDSLSQDTRAVRAALNSLPPAAVAR